MSKKTAKNTKEFRQYSIGDHVLGKVRGYPPWPGMVVDPESAPQAVLNEQPPGKKSTFHCILFFPMGDYAWLHPKDLSSLKRHEIELYLSDESKKRNGDLREGYRIALDPTEWLADKKKQRLAAAQQEAEEQEQVDQLDSETDEPKKSKSSKKRKRDSDEELIREKKTTKAKKDSAESMKKKTGATKSKKNGKSKSMVESEDDGEHAQDDADDDAGPSKASPPPTKKMKHDKDDEGDDSKLSGDPQSLRVRDWRHKLQKTFLSHKTLPKAEVMPDIDQLFTTVENYNDMTIEQLQFSKIGKVMRHIAALPDEKVPRDNDFKFRGRAKSLVERWHQILNANKPGPESPSEVTGNLNGKSEGKEEKITDDVTQGTKNIDLNGKDDSFRSVDLGQSTAEGDSSLLADVTMSEA